MEFAWNTQKNKMSDVKGKEMEQDRKGRKSNPDIDDTRTNMNYDLVESDKTLYQRVKARVDEVRSVSRIQKNSVVDFSNIITVPKEQYEKWGLEKSKDYLKEVYNYFCEEFGKENVVSAKIHLDETTPHIHLHFVPINQENGKLQARALMTPARINKIHTEAPKYLQGKGYEVERGKGKTEKNLDIHRFKAEKIKEDINILENKLKALESDLKAFERVESSFDKIDSIKAKKSPLGAKISVKEDDYKLLIDLSKKSLVLSSKVNDLQGKVDNLENELSKKTLSLDERLEFHKLKSENKDLKNTISKANKIIGSMSKEFQNEFLKAKKEIENSTQKYSKIKSKTFDLER